MGNCMAVEVREQPEPYYDRTGQPRHVVVREKNQPLYRRSDESSLYRPRSYLSIQYDDYRPQDNSRSFNTRKDDHDDYHISRAPADYRNNRPFQPLPPLVPPAPLLHPKNNNPHDLGVVALGDHQPDHNGIQVMDDNPVEIMRRSPRPHRKRRQMVVHASRRGHNEPKYYDDSDDDSWFERSPRTGYSEDSWVESVRPAWRRGSRWRSRSRNNGRYHR